jgi:serralysin
MTNSGTIVGDVELYVGADPCRALGAGVEYGTIFGNDGDETLIGSKGKDIPNGGLGVDTFTFSAAAQSVVGAQRDTIQDFQVGTDLIDLGPMVGPVFQFVGSNAFSGGGAQQVRVQTLGGQHTLVQIDSDGNGTADSESLATPVSGLTAADFIL